METRAGRVEYLVAAGRRLEYRWIPPRRTGAPALVFLHEALGSIGLWRDFPDRVAERTGGGALVYSRAGHGGSERGSDTRGVGHFAEEALIVLPKASSISTEPSRRWMLSAGG